MGNVMRIAKPPVPGVDIHQKLFELPPEKFFEYNNKFKATDEKGRYLHWNKFRFIYKEHSDLAWFLTKMSRKSLSKDICLCNKYFSFCVPESLQSLLHFIDKTSGGNIGSSNLEGLGKEEQNIFLIKSLIMEEAITSAQLEGAATTRKIAKDMLRSGRNPKNKDELMILNNYRLMQEAIKLKDEELSLDLILNLHRIATEHAIENNATPGQFREDNQTYIMGEKNEILFTPPLFEELRSYIDDLCIFVNTDHNSSTNNFIHPVIKAVIIHFFIGFIHPFGDGNGRTARALFYWFMLKNGYWLFEYISISRLLKSAPASYCKAYLYTESDDLDMTYFIFYQVDIIKRAIQDLHKYISSKQKKTQDFISNIISDKNQLLKNLSYRQIQILQKAAKEPGKIFSAKEISNEYVISDNTARKDLNQLAELKLLATLKKGKSTNYISPNDLLERLKA
jgi:fic family protein